MFLAPDYLQAIFLDPIYKIEHTSHHVAKLHGNQPMVLADLTLNKKMNSSKNMASHYYCRPMGSRKIKFQAVPKSGIQ